MKTSQRTPDYSATPPPPSIQAGRQALIDHITSDAIDNYETARRRNAAYEAAAADDRALDEFSDLNVTRLLDAKYHLVRVLLERSSRKLGVDREQRWHVVQPACGVIAGGRLYLASVDSDESEEPVGRLYEGSVMHLVVADVADVVSMDLAMFDDLDGARRPAG